MNKKQRNNKTVLHRGDKASPYTYAMLSIAGVLSFLLLWQIVTDTGLVSSRYLTQPVELVKLFFAKFTDTQPEGATLPMNIAASLKIAVIGLVLAIVIGVPLGWLMGWYPNIDAFVKPVFEIIRPIPPISWIPLTIVWLGIGIGAKAFIIFFSPTPASSRRAPSLLTSPRRAGPRTLPSSARSAFPRRCRSRSRASAWRSATRGPHSWRQRCWRPTSASAT